MAEQIKKVQEKLLLLSPFLEKLGRSPDQDKVVFFLEGTNLNAKDSLEKIMIFAEEEYAGKEIVFVEHIHQNHWQIQKKEKDSWDLTRHIVASDGRCGIVSTIVALRELGLITKEDSEEYIETTTQNKLKSDFIRGDVDFRKKIIDFLCDQISDEGTKAEEKAKINNLLSSSNSDNWLNSDTIKEILRSKSGGNIKLFDSASIPAYNYLFAKPEDARYEVATVLLGLLNQKITIKDRVNFIQNFSDLFQQEEPGLKDKLGFLPDQQIEFSDIFPINESLEKARTFYSKNQESVENFLRTFSDLEMQKPNLGDTEFQKLFKNVGLLIYQINHIKNTDAGYLDTFNINAVKQQWDLLAQSSNLDQSFKDELTSIQNRWKFTQERTKLAETLEKGKQRTITKNPNNEPDKVFAVFMDSFEKLKTSNSITDKAIFLSTCDYISSNAASLKSDKCKPFLQSFANFFFDNLEHFEACGDNYTKQEALSQLISINQSFDNSKLGCLEDYLEDEDRKKHYQKQKANFESGQEYIPMTTQHNGAKQELQEFASEVLQKTPDYLEELFTKLNKHFKEPGEFSKKIEKLSEVFKDDPVLKSFASSFAIIDSPLIPDSFQPTPKHAYHGWGKKIEMTSSKESGEFSLILDGKEIEKIEYGDKDKLDSFRKIDDEKLRAIEIANFFRTASKDIKIHFKDIKDCETLKSEDRAYYQDNGNGEICRSDTNKEEKVDSLKEKLQKLRKQAVTRTEEDISVPQKPSNSPKTRSDGIGLLEAAADFFGPDGICGACVKDS